MKKACKDSKKAKRIRMQLECVKMQSIYGFLFIPKFADFR